MSIDFNIPLLTLSRLIFWSDKGEENGGYGAKIERATTDGRDRRTVIDSGLSSPRGVTLDRRDRRVYWVDPEDGTINSITYDGRDKQTIISGQQNINLFDVTLYQVNNIKQSK